MGYLTVGSLTIPYAWIAFLLAYFYIDLRHRKSEAIWPNRFDQLLWTYLISWKASYIIFYFKPFIAAPMSILYFDGGWKGHVVALGVATIIFVRKKMMEGLVPIFVIWLQFLAVYFGVFSLFSGQYLLSVFAVLALLLVEKKADVWVFALIFMLLVLQGNWMSPFLWVTALFLVLLVVKDKQPKFVAPVVVATLVGLFAMNVVELSVGESKEVKPLELQTVDGETYSLIDDKNSIVILNFFATWCPPCKAETPHLQAFAENIPNNVSFISVNLTARDHGNQELERFIKEFDVTYPILLDENDKYGDAYGVLSMPTTVILKDGKEVQRIVGPVSEETLGKIVGQYKE